MFTKNKDFQDALKQLQNLRKQLDGVDINNPAEFLKSVGVDPDSLDKMISKDIKLRVPLKYKNESSNEDPFYHYEGDSGFDLRSDETIFLDPMERKLVGTGIFLEIPPSYEIQVRTKSGLALKRGLMVLNSPGTIDANYTGEIKVILMNMSKEPQTINVGEKIAQAVLCPVMPGGNVILEKALNINETDRGSNGFGSTGV